MSWSVIIFLLILGLTGLLCFLLLNLNDGIINIDLLFFEVDISIGFALLISFLGGFLVTLTLEVTYFLMNRRKGNE